MSEPRIVCQFSCGAAPAVAQPLTDSQLEALGKEWFRQITKGVGTGKAVEAMRALLAKGE